MGRPRKLTAQQRQEAIDRREAGETFQDIARSYNVNLLERPDGQGVVDCSWIAEQSVMASSGGPTKRSKIFSQPVYLEIARLVDQGLSAAEIADRIGCKLGTLRVKCSQFGISLRRHSGARSEAPSPLWLGIHLSHDTAMRLQKHAKEERTSGAKLAAELLEMIVRDNLYGAVLDRDRTD